MASEKQASQKKTFHSTLFFTFLAEIMVPFRVGEVWDDLLRGRGPTIVSFPLYVEVSGIRTWSCLAIQLLMIPTPWVLLRVGWPTARRFQSMRLPPVSLQGIGMLSSNLPLSLHFYFSMFFPSLLFSFFFKLFIPTSCSQPLVFQLWTSFEASLSRACFPSAAIRGGGGERMTWHFSYSLGCGER